MIETRFGEGGGFYVNVFRQIYSSYDTDLLRALFTRSTLSIPTRTAASTCFDKQPAFEEDGSLTLAAATYPVESS